MDIQINIYFFFFKSINFAIFPEEPSVSSAGGCQGNEPLTDSHVQSKHLGFFAEKCAFVTNRTWQCRTYWMIHCI